MTADRRLGIVYVPDARSISLDLQMLADKSVVARWYDPRQGHFVSATGPIKGSGKKSHTFATPANLVAKTIGSWSYKHKIDARVSAKSDSEGWRRPINVLGADCHGLLEIVSSKPIQCPSIRCVCLAQGRKYFPAAAQQS